MIARKLEVTYLIHTFGAKGVISSFELDVFGAKRAHEVLNPLEQAKASS